jgi:hypothetical protein
VYCLPVPRKIKPSKQALAALRREQKRKALVVAKAKEWRPGKSYYGKLVFVSSATGYPMRGPVNRRKGFLVRVSRKGAKRFLLSSGRNNLVPRRLEAYEPERTKLPKKLVEAFYAKKLETVVLRSTRSKGAISWKTVEKNSLGNLKAFAKKYRGNKKVLFKVRLKSGKKRIGFSLGLSYAQLQDLKAGRYEWLRDYLWKGISTELAQDNLVTTGSFNYIKGLKRNKGKSPSKWKTKSGELWGKGKYRKVELSDLETDIFTLKK